MPEFIIGFLDRLPDTGDKVETDTVTLIVDSMDKNRIDRIAIMIDPALQDDKK